MPTFDTPEPITIVAELAVGNITVNASDRVDTVVEVSPTNPASRADISAAEQTRVDYRDGRLTITGRSWQMWKPWRGRESVEVHIDVPSGSRLDAKTAVANLSTNGSLGDVSFKTAAGNVEIDDSRALDVSASSGSVHVGRAAGRVVVKCTNGETVVHEATGEVRVHAANGRVVVDHAHADVEAKSANGDIVIGQVERGTVTANTARGSIDIGVRDGVAAWLDLDTSFGRIESQLDAAASPVDGDSTVEVKARTAFGNVTVRRAVAADA